jgi:hypothetical protein
LKQFISSKVGPVIADLSHEALGAAADFVTSLSPVRDVVDDVGGAVSAAAGAAASTAGKALGGAKDVAEDVAGWFGDLW